MSRRQALMERNDVIAAVLPPVFLAFHFFHLVQMGSIVFSNEMRSVGPGRFVGLAALYSWFALAVIVTLRTGTIPIPVAAGAMLTTTIFLLAVLPSMTVAAWRLHGTWLGIAAADSLVCYAVQEARRVRVFAACACMVVMYAFAVFLIDGAWLLKMPQFLSPACNMPAVTVALLGIGTILRSAIAAKSAAEAELAVARERNRFHRLIHDAALQPLEALAGGWDVDIEAVRDNARQQAVLLRTALREESGLDDLVLSERLRALAAQWNGRGLEVRCQLDAPDMLLAPPIAVAFTGAAGEALANVAKHANCSKATLTSSIRGDRLKVSVHDDGQGFDPETVSFGLGLSLSVHERMREVGGCAEVESAPGKGTTVVLSVPC